jgi:hypothetical protein
MINTVLYECRCGFLHLWDEDCKGAANNFENSEADGVAIISREDTREEREAEKARRIALSMVTRRKS